MKKILNASIAIIVIITIIVPATYAYVIKQNNKTEEFFEIAKTEVSKNEKVEMTIYLDRIDYNEFEISLTSSESLDKIEVDNELDESKIEKENNEITMYIDKTKTNLSEIKLYYQLLDDIEVNDEITFTATLISKDGNTQTNTITTSQDNSKANDENVENDEKTKDLNKKTDDENVDDKGNNVVNDEKDSNQINNENVIKEESNNDKNTIQNEVKKVSVKVKVVEEKATENKTLNEKENQKDGETMPSDETNKGQNSETRENDKSSQTMQAQEVTKTAQTTQNQANTKTVQTTQISTSTVTYNGSQNNYLSTLSVDGYELNRAFTKDNLTYFVTVDSSISSLNINAEAEESTAKINIYGNTDLGEGTNKILVNVTAENGNIRTYRIYAIKSSDETTDKRPSESTLATCEVESALTEKIELHATYYLEESYVETNQIVKAGENILKYTNGTYLTAPYDCVITKISIPDENAQCTNQHYIQISSVNSLEAQFKIDETKAETLSVGDEVTITIESQEVEIKGTITNISNTASNGKFTVTVEFANSGEIMLGMTAKIAKAQN